MSGFGEAIADASAGPDPVPGPRRSRGRRRFGWNVDAPDLAEVFLASAVAAVLAIRAYLAATGYPKLGGSSLHIAHVLWGGLLMVAALLMLLVLLGSLSRIVAAVVGGIGFGAFIDELGKFLTHDNNYFFRPAIALIYGVFVLLFLVVRALPRERRWTRAERLGYVYRALTDLALGRLSRKRRRRALELLAGLGDADPEGTTDTREREVEELVVLRALLGVASLVRGARSRALALFYRAAQISIFFAQFFAFVAVQLLALPALALNVLVLVALRVEIAVEAEREGPTAS